MPIKINGATSGSTTITAPATGSDESIELSTALASKLPYSYGTATPSTTDSGFLWYDSNSTPPVAKYWNGSSFATLAPAPGLELIDDDTFTTSSAISLNGVFSATYRNYLILVTATHSTNGNINMRLRTGSDDTGTNYADQILYAAGTAVTASRQSAASFWRVGYSYSNAASAVIHVMRPNVAAATQFYSQSMVHSGASVEIATFSGDNTQTTQYTGFTLLPGAGTFTGTVAVYGYKGA